MTVDATLDLEAPGLLEEALHHVVRSIASFEALTLVVRLDQETAEVYQDDETFVAPLGAEDWCVTGRSVEELAAKLRELL